MTRLSKGCPIRCSILASKLQKGSMKFFAIIRTALVRLQTLSILSMASPISNYEYIYRCTVGCEGSRAHEYIPCSLLQFKTSYELFKGEIENAMLPTKQNAMLMLNGQHT